MQNVVVSPSSFVEEVRFEALGVEALLYTFLIIPYIFWMLRQVIEHCVALPFVRYFKTDIHRRAHWSWVSFLCIRLVFQSVHIKDQIFIFIRLNDVRTGKYRQNQAANQAVDG
jgi:hypothetical protein